MTDHDERELSASEAVAQFSHDIKAAIAEVVEKTPELAKDTAKTEARTEASRRAVSWYIVTILVAWIGAAAFAWLIAVYLPAHSNVEFIVRYQGTSVMCSRALDTPDGHPVLTCVPSQ